MEIIDTTLREGLQSPIIDDAGKYTVSIQERGDIFTALMSYGVKYVEVFSPLVNHREKESLEYLIQLRNSFEKKHHHRTHILNHVRCAMVDIEAALAYDIDGLNVYIGTSEQNRTHGHGKQLEEIVKTAVPILKSVRHRCPKLLLRFSGEDAFRTNVQDLFMVYDSIAPYVDRFGIPDTVGTAIPKNVITRIQLLKERYPHIALEGHFHNDRNFSMINAIEAVNNGMEFVQTSVMGLGERSGITSLTGLIFNLFIHNPEIAKQYKIDQSYALNVLVANIIGIQVPTTEPVSLTNRTHSAGVHTSAMLKGQNAYEAHDLSNFGVNNYRLLLGALSGKHIIRYYLTHVLNYIDVTEEKAIEIADVFKNRSHHLDKDNKPVALLNEIAAEFNLARVNKPVTHQENLSQ